MADEKEKNIKSKKEKDLKKEAESKKTSNKSTKKNAKEQTTEKKSDKKIKKDEKKNIEKKKSGKHAEKNNNKDEKSVKNFKEKFKNLKWKKIGIISGSCIAGVYVLGALIFSFITFPNTIVADTDISFHTQNLMKQALIPNAGEYKFSADGYGFDLEIEGATIEYDFDVDEVVDRVFALKNPLTWPVEVFGNHDFMEESVVSFNKEAATAIASLAIDGHNATAVRPQNADFICNAETKTVGIKDEVIGNAIDPQNTLDSILGYIGTGRRHLELGDKEHLTPTLYAGDERIPAAIEQANKLLQSVMTLQLSTTVISTIDYNLLSLWIQLKEEYIPGLNDELLTAWVASLANQYDTLGKSRTFTTPYGKTCTVSGGDAIGWKIDQPALIEEINKQVVLGVPVVIATPCSSSMNGYVGPGARDWGPRYIDVDLSEQKARMYGDAGQLVWQADIVSGKPSTMTPTGLYTVKGKQSPTVLIGAPDPITGEPSYRSPVQFWMPFIGNSIGFHDASWQTEFGGDRWIEYGSHGCINLAYDTAQSLYSLCVSGDIVVVHY